MPGTDPFAKPAGFKPFGNPFAKAGTSPFATGQGQPQAWAQQQPSFKPTVPPNTAIDQTTGEALVHPDDPKQFYDRDDLLADWVKTYRDMERVKAKEMELRKLVTAVYTDPAKNKGTENVPLQDGWNLKVGKRLNYKIGSKDEAKTHRQAVDEAFEKFKMHIASTGTNMPPSLVHTTAVALIDSLFKLNWELSQTAYKALSPGLRTIADDVITVTEGAPVVELEPPKEAP